MTENKDLILLKVGDPYPLSLPSGEGAIADFLRPIGNRMLVYLDFTEEELLAVKDGQMKAGLLYENGAMLLLFVFEKDGVRLNFDCPFDARLIERIEFKNLTTGQERLLIEIHIIPYGPKKLVGLRQITMTPELTLEFLSNVQEQLCELETGDEQLRRWMEYSTKELVFKANMHVLGC